MTTTVGGAIAGIEKRLEIRVLVLVVHSHAGDEVQLLVQGHRALAEHAEAEIVELRDRRILIDRELDELREHERRERVHRVLLVALREEEDAGLPPERAPRRTACTGATDATRTSCVNWKSSSALLRVTIGSGE